MLGRTGVKINRPPIGVSKERGGGVSLKSSCDILTVGKTRHSSVGGKIQSFWRVERSVNVIHSTVRRFFWKGGRVYSSSSS